MKKIIICSPQLGISPQSNSGGEVYDRETIKALCDQGAKVIVILPWRKPYLKHKNLIVYYLPIPFVWPPYLFNFLIIPYLFYLYKKHKFDILRVHSPYFVGLGTLVFKFFYRKAPLVAHYHHLEDKVFFHFINKLLIKSWSLITTDSQFTKNEIIKCYQQREVKIKVIYAGVEARFKPQKKNQILVKKYDLEKKKVFLSLGGLKKRKNVAFLLKLLKQINDEDVKLLISGQGKQKQALMRQVIELGLKNRVVFSGFVPEKQKVDYYNLADIFLFPSKLEGFGMPIIEAGACGIPVVASKTSSLRELVIPGKTGYLAKLDNLHDWKNKTIKLLKDKKLRQSMGEEGKKFSRQFSWQQSAVKQIKIYKLLAISH